MVRYNCLIPSSIHYTIVAVLLILVIILSQAQSKTGSNQRGTFQLQSQSQSIEIKRQQQNDVIKSRRQVGTTGKLFCLILTQPKYFFTRTIAVNISWAHECDEHKFVTIIPDLFLLDSSMVRRSDSGSIEIVDYPFRLLQPAGYKEKKFKDLTNKVYAAFVDIYRRYSNFDWFLKADDDTMVLVDNLKKFVSQRNANKPLTYGFRPNKFRSGVSGGYVLSREALRRLGHTLVHDRSSCPDTGVEDVDMAACLAKLNVSIGDSVDELGRERFHPYNLTFHWHKKHSPRLHEASLRYSKKTDVNKCCSEESISFHAMSPEQMSKLKVFWVIYKNLKQTDSNVTFRNFVIKHVMDPNHE